MSLTIASINSGSNGNCYYVGNETEAVFIDAGLTCRETEKRMKRSGLLMEKVKAIFISHEHGDHIKGVDVIAAKYKLPVYITPLTLKHSRLQLSVSLVRHFVAGDSITIGGLTIHSFLKQHDAADPCSFRVSNNGISAGVFTDIGAPCQNLAAHFKLCHAAILESNYDETMLMTGRYPQHLKNRIHGDTGHLSNRQAAEFCGAYKPDFMSLVLLAHLSKENNSPAHALASFQPHAGKMEITVASRDVESKVYHLKNTPDKITPIRPVQAQKLTQATLF